MYLISNFSSITVFPFLSFFMLFICKGNQSICSIKLPTSQKIWLIASWWCSLTCSSVSWISSRLNVKSRAWLYVLVAQSGPALCDPTDCSLPGSSVHGIFQAGILEWLPCPPPEDFLNQGLNLCLLHLLNCRRILYPLSHLGSPIKSIYLKKIK